MNTVQSNKEKFLLMLQTILNTEHKVLDKLENIDKRLTRIESIMQDADTDELLEEIASSEMSASYFQSAPPRLKPPPAPRGRQEPIRLLLPSPKHED